MKPFELFCVKDTKNAAALLFFLAASNKKFQRANANTNKAGWTRDSQLGLTSMYMARGFSVLYHGFARKQCILCSELRHKSCLTLVYVTSIRDFFCPWNNRVLLYYGAARLLIGNNNNNKYLYVFISKMLYPLISINKFIAKEKGSDTSTA